MKRLTTTALPAAALALTAILWVAGLARAPLVLANPASTRPIDFSRDVRPILSDKCFHCHGPDEKHRKGDLRLDTRDGAFRDLGGYRALVAGKPEASELIARITTDDPSELMPPRKSLKKLTPEEIDTLVAWVKQGAPYAEHWAYVEPVQHAAPSVDDRRWTRGSIDRWILSRLEREGLAASPEADRPALIRRLSFDLTGLPPSREDVADFVTDEHPLAYERLVDRLLASPAFGARMAMYWLDLVRYADSVGYHGDQEHSASPYRDWVIDAFNADMPFDQFTVEQLAGDLLPDASVDQRIASGYNRLLQTSHEGGVQQKEYLAIYAADRIRNFSGVWLGATLGCAQCHDHKYDPFTTKDFYSAVAFFADIDEAQHFKVGSNSLPTRRPPEISVLRPLERERVAEIDAELSRSKSVAAAGSASPATSDDFTAHVAALESEKKAIEGKRRPTMITVSIDPRPIRVLPRGNWLDDSGDLVSPQGPHFMKGVGTATERATRLDLARWLTRDIAGLTGRVFVNRLWYLLFGTGLAKVLDDLGGQGEPPAHPELLDQLAIDFVKSGWDVKGAVRTIVCSSAYRQTSVTSKDLRDRDPDNRLVARQSTWRLPAESIRDNSLAISGLLIRKHGDLPVRPYQPPGYYRHLNFPTRSYRADDGENQYRRGVYTHWQRMFLHPAMLAFDAPTREECTAQRPVSNTPVAALTLLNDPSYVESSRVFAARILSEGGTGTPSRLRWAFETALARTPASEEADVLASLLSTHLKNFRNDADAARAVLENGLSTAGADLDLAELAAWTSVARTILNLSETITRN